MYTRRSPVSSQAMKTFLPACLMRSGRACGVDTFTYMGVRIDASSDGCCICVSLSAPLPLPVLEGMLAFFGMDLKRHVTSYRFPGEGRYYVQPIKEQAA